MSGSGSDHQKDSNGSELVLILSKGLHQNWYSQASRGHLLLEQHPVR